MAEPVLRKLNQPVYERTDFRRMTSYPVLVLCGATHWTGVSVYFSQIFCKALNGSVAKPVHQDNLYFDSDNTDALITAWIALDDATVGNGCLCFAEGTHLGPSLSSRGSGRPTIQFTGVTRHRSTIPHVTGTGG